MKILLAHADTEALNMLTSVLLAEGHETLVIHDGTELMQAMQDDPDLLILDANLPSVSGFECCRQIKHDEKYHLKPVVLLMPTKDAAAWARFAECRADDFIPQPLNTHLIKAKVKLLLHLDELYHRLEASHRHAEQEIRLAKQMFDTITRRQSKEVDFLHYWGLSAGHFCGDLFIFERTPDNHLHIFLGDFTGHGLAAAMGALPVSDIFFAMTRKGASVSDIIKEMNRKLFEMMPTGKFCAAALLSMDADYSKIEIWNGGLPPILLVDGQHRIVGKQESFHMPLGIADAAEFSAQTIQLELKAVHSVVVCSDGLIEAQNSLGEIFSEAQLEAAIVRRAKERNTFNRIKTSVLSFLDGLEPTDDISLAVLNIY